MLGDGGGDQPPLTPCMWEGGLITDILQEAWLDDHITETCDLVSRGSHFVLQYAFQEWGTSLSQGKRCWVWFRRPIQLDKEISTDWRFKESCSGRLLCYPWGCGREEDEGQRARATTWEENASQNLWAAAYDVEEWMQDITGDSDGEPRWNDNSNHGPD